MNEISKTQQSKLSELNKSFTLQELIEVCAVILLALGILIYGSVCSGIEAATVAWKPLGWELAWTSQYDPEHKYKGLPPAEWRGVSKPSKSGKWRPDFASRVLAHHYPGVVNLGDMTTIAERVLAGTVEAPDVLVGGCPCQAFSLCGNRIGLNDPRGNITLAYVQLLNAIDTVRIARGERPAVACWENVPGCLSDSNNAFGHFLAALAGASEPLPAPPGRWPSAGVVGGPKRAVVWRCLNSEYFGVPQSRQRLFVVAGAGADIERLAEILIERAAGDDLLCDREAEGGHLPCFKRCDGGLSLERLSHVVFANGGFRKLTPLEWERCFGFPDNYTLIPGVKVADGSRYNALGNAMAVPVMRWIGERIARFASGDIL
jgi:site-specific DNA-cytosine methylase